MTSNRIGDAPVLPDLLAQIPTDEPIGSVTADCIYDTKGCHAAIAARGADAIIPPRRNARARKGLDPALRARKEALRPCKWFGRANWKKLSEYQGRSRVEAKMRCFKLLGERIMARDFDRQDAEVQICIALMNRFHITRHARDRSHALTQAGKAVSAVAITIAQQSRSGRPAARNGQFRFLLAPESALGGTGFKACSRLAGPGGV